MIFLIKYLVAVVILVSQVSCSQGLERSPVLSVPKQRDADGLIGLEGLEDLMVPTELDSNQSLLEKIQVLKKVAKKRQDAFYRMSNQEDQLLKKMRAITDMGCRLEQKIKSIKVFAKAYKKPPKSYGLHHSKVEAVFSLDKSIEEKKKLTVSFADGITKSTTDLSGFFQSSGEVASLSMVDVGDKKLSDLQHIRVYRHGFYVLTETQISTYHKGFWGNLRGKSISYEYIEMLRYQLTAIKVLVNGINIYENNNLDHGFYFPQSVWQDYQLKDHPNYLALYTEDSSVCAE